MKKLIVTASVLSMFVAAPAMAEFYGAIGAGANLRTDVNVSGTGIDFDMHTDPGFAGSLAVGYQIPSWWHVRAEAEYLYMSGNIVNHPISDALQFRTNAVMANVYLPIPIPVVQIYAGAGIGMMQSTGYDKDADVGNTSDYDVAYQAIVGIEFELPVIKALGIEARYLRGQANFPGVEVSADNWLLMARVRF